MSRMRGQRRRTLVVLAFAIGILVIGLAFTTGRLSWLTGSVQQLPIGNQDFVIAVLDQADAAVPVPAGTHAIVTCPQSIPENARLLAPSDFTTTNLRIYEYTDDYREKTGTWTGKRYGFGQNPGDTLMSFTLGKRYYVRADTAFTFRCTDGLTVDSNVYVTDSGNRYVMRLADNGAFTPIFDPADGILEPRSIDYDAQAGRLYWIGANPQNTSVSVILRGQTDGTGLSTLVSDASHKDKLKVDVIGQHLYWIDETNNVVRRSDLNGQNITTVIPYRPNDFAVDPVNGFIYWTDASASSIKRTTIASGITSTILYTPGAPFDRILLHNGNLYWTYQILAGGNLLTFVYRTDVQGQHQVLLGIVPTSSANTLTIHEIAINGMRDYIYWTYTLITPTTHSTSLLRSTLTGGSITTLLARTDALTQYYGIAMAHTLSYPLFTGSVISSSASSSSSSVPRPQDFLDINHDGTITVGEAGSRTSQLYQIVGIPSSPYDPFYDISGDGNLTPLDLLQVINYMNAHLSVDDVRRVNAYVQMDSDHDGVLLRSEADIRIGQVTLLLNFVIGEPGFNALYDLNQDNIISTIDLLIFINTANAEAQT